MFLWLEYENELPTKNASKNEKDIKLISYNSVCLEQYMTSTSLLEPTLTVLLVLMSSWNI